MAHKPAIKMNPSCTLSVLIIYWRFWNKKRLNASYGNCFIYACIFLLHSIFLSLISSDSSNAACARGWGLCPSGGCAPLGSVCCGNRRHCPSGSICAGSKCLSRKSIRVCPDGRYCNPGHICMNNGRCLPTSSPSYCGGSSYCKNGGICVDGGCLARNSPRVCADGRYCRQGHICVNNETCLSIDSPRYCGGSKYCESGKVCLKGRCYADDSQSLQADGLASDIDALKREIKRLKGQKQ